MSLFDVHLAATYIDSCINDTRFISNSVLYRFDVMVNVMVK